MNNTTTIGSILTIIDQLEKTSSSNDKISILQANSSNELLKKVFEMALNPFHNYWIKKIPDLEDNHDSIVIIHSDHYSSLEEGLDFLSSRLEKRVVTGNAAILELKEQLENMFIDDQEIICRILERDMKCGVSTKTINKVWKGLIPVFPVMLCSKSSDEKNLAKMTFPAFVQKKEDGGRLLASVTETGVTYHSRNGRPLDLLDAKFTTSLIEMRKQHAKEDFILDGELLLLDKNGEISNRQTGNGIMNKAVRGTLTASESVRLLYTVWDMISLNDVETKAKSNVPYETRFKNLNESYIQNDNHFRIVESHIVSSLDETKEVFEQMLAAGHEGIILKDRNGIFEGKRVKHQIKFKAEETADLKIVDVIEGTGKYVGMMGSLECETSCGLLSVGVGTGFSDDDRKLFWENRDITIDRIVEVGYNSVIKEKTNKKNSSLFLPVYKGIREDKLIANTLDELK